MIKFGSQYKKQDDKSRKVIMLSLLSCRVLFGALLATFTTFLAIKVLNPVLMEKIAQSSRFAEFLFNKKFVLGLGIALMGVLLLAKLSSGIAAALNQDSEPNPTAKEQLYMWPQVAIGISVAITGIVCMSLMLANKISPQASSIMEKVFLGGFGVAIAATFLTGLVMLIGGIIINKTMTRDEAQPHNRRLNEIATISGALFGGLSYAILGTLPFIEGNNGISVVRDFGCRDNYITRNDQSNVTIHFLDVFKVEFQGKVQEHAVSSN